jgi:hypothetical protein
LAVTKRLEGRWERVQQKGHDRRGCMGLRAVLKGKEKKKKRVRNANRNPTFTGTLSAIHIYTRPQKRC